VSLSKPFQSRDIGGVVGDDGVGSVECVCILSGRTGGYLTRTYKLDSIGAVRKRKGKGTNEYNTFINKLITIEAKHNGYDITASAEQETVDRMLSDVFKDVDMDEMYNYYRV
jgi:translation initiation factor RLI1